MSSLARTSTLLAEVFPGAHTSGLPYLRWLYEESPFGPVLEANLDDAAGRSGHYAVVPMTIAIDGRPHAAALSLNTAVHERVRGTGVFTRLAEEAYAHAEQRGIEMILGVANANSTPGFVGRLGFDLLGPLPVTTWMTRPATPVGWTTAAAGSAEADALIDAGAPLMAPPASGMARVWTPETLRWRLRAPGGRYLVHGGPDTLVVSTHVRRGPVRIAVVLAAFTATKGAGRAVQRGVAAAHRTPLGVYAGINQAITFTGRPLPTRLRPSPLNLIRRLLREMPQAPVARFEFLDFDAF